MFGVELMSCWLLCWCSVVSAGSRGWRGQRNDWSQRAQDGTFPGRRSHLTWLLASTLGCSCSLCLLQDFAVPAELLKAGLRVLFAFRAGIAVVGTRFHPGLGLLFHWQCWHVHCVVSCFWGCCFLELILQMTHKCCSVWHCSAWREAVACFVVYLGNELFSPLKCILPLREIKASR